ncbi:type I-U CRISPR-associated protein Csb2 [Streptomyces sp. NPDC088394]|uniref:type I-G CRISPR-associated protein Csb2 n=1 Tax=Streptomyces sp. NPDC088394 TaxID=3365860 RepID=UPI0037F1498F
MITLALHFPWKRYHATPWGHFVNEGAVELPPSLWRILRALYSTWKERCPDLDADQVHQVLTRLSSPPTYRIPPHHLSHSRHYFPDSTHRSGSSAGTDLALDAFAALGGDATIYVQWPGDLTTDQTKTLAQLAETLPYLGRADSIVEARLLTSADDIPTDTHTPAVQLNDDDLAPNGWTNLELLAPTIPLDLDGLTMRPTDVRTRSLLYPPGSRLLSYATPVSHPHAPPPAHRPRAKRKTEKITAVRLTINGPALPPLTQTLPLTDTLRSRCIKPLTPGNSRQAPRHSNLAGKTADGTPLTGHHHAHFLPWDTNHDRRIDEIIIWTPGGLDTEELDAIHQATTGTIGVPEGVPGPRRLHLRITAYGAATDVLPAEWTKPATRYTSLTPFIPTRHPKKRQTLTEFFTAEAARELAHRQHPAPAQSKLLQGDWPLYTQHRWTKRETRNDNRPSRGLHLTFDEPLSGPLALGRYSHFGLGLLFPTPTSEPQAHQRHAERAEA